MKSRTAAAALALAVTLCCCSAPNAQRAAIPETPSYGYQRTAIPAEYTDVSYNPWDVEEAASQTPEQPLRRHTVLIYMNGSDLESETGAATVDIREITGSGFDQDEVNVLLFTGGANRWVTPAIPEWECTLTLVSDGELRRIAGVGQRNMGDAGTLAAFLLYAHECFPADRTSLILWDHGGGTIAGYGADEHFADGNLTLRELEYAFYKAGLADRKLEMLGFDACLMATAEVAVTASGYAEWLVASEALEPQGGWDYAALRWLGSHPDANGEEFGRAITDAYIASAGIFPWDELSLSVTRLDVSAALMGALGVLADRMLADVATDAGFFKLRTVRANTKTFGDGTPFDAECDMADIYDLARRLRAYYPDEVRAVTDALSRAVVYSRDTSSSRLGGLTAYFIFGDRADPYAALGVYRSLGMSDKYTLLQSEFAAKLYASNRDPEPGTRRAEIFGETAALYEIAAPDGGGMYAARAYVNGQPASLVVWFPEGNSDGELLGYRKCDGWLIQKGFIPLEDSDFVELP
ncbi:MAG: hypothetical protein LBS90_01295 [Oscillospiraceae bacterium]|jgi:hypothetical protein|nr:hypothetical protein [Oscillospiraceae bacterium]